MQRQGPHPSNRASGRAGGGEGGEGGGGRVLKYDVLAQK